ncbi:MAG TPA: hypothetical protein VMM81_00050 [Acidimicrobiia bacterium]|nr:hypothetical protein [Acidimicrobiia bacterium]
MSPKAFRNLMLGLGLALAALVVTVIALDTDGDPLELPGTLRSVYPQPNDMVLSQVGLEINLPVGYEITLTVDGVAIPVGEISVTPEIGQFRWRPAQGRVVETWAPGEHTIEITWDRVAGGPPDPGEFSWTFRVS